VGDPVASGLALGSGLASGDGLGVASGVGLSLGVGLGIGERFFFFLLDLDDGDADGVAVTDDCGVGVALAFGVAELFGDGLALGDALGFGVAEGVTLAVGEGDVFGAAFFLVELFRFFGAGVGSKICLILSPNDCAPEAGGATSAPRSTAMHETATAMFRPIRFNEIAPSGSPC
jgi:hypothetical protein